MRKSYPTLRYTFWLLLLLVFVPTIEAQGPSTPPDGNTGQTIYDNRCANCHGPMGGGDGELAPNAVNPPTAFAAPDYRQAVIPTDLFTTISNGRLTRGMPLFGPGSSNPLDEAEIWDLVATIYSFSTPVEAIESGQVVYEATCQACHGANGDEVSEADLTDLNYWFTRNNLTVGNNLNETAVAAHQFTLSEEEAANVVDFARTFSYVFNDVSAALAPIEDAVIGGQVVNGSTVQQVGEGTVTLRGFTPNLDIGVTLTAEVDENGRYQFQLTEVPPELIFVTSIEYGGFNFNSEPARLNGAVPVLELPVIVYEATSDASAITVDQLLIVVNFLADIITVDEVYLFNNAQTAVFTGPTGDPENGTLELNLPAGAANVRFERSFEGIDSPIPATEIVQTETGWVDTLPMQPGRSVNILVSYDLPYRDGMTLAHPLRYNTNELIAFVPDTGVQLSGGAWSVGSVAEVPGGPYMNHTHEALAADEAMAFTLNGTPSLVTDAAGNALLVRDETTELIVGGTILLLTIIAVAFMMVRWRAPVTPVTTNELLQSIADLDDAYENGRLREHTYQQKRHQLKEELKRLWPSG